MKLALPTMLAVMITIGLLAGFTGPVAAQSNTADATDTDQANLLDLSDLPDLPNTAVTS